MNPETQQAIEEFVRNVLLNTNQQMPLLVEEWLRWRAMETLAWTILGGIAFLGGITSILCALFKIKDEREAEPFFWIGLFVAFIGGAITLMTGSEYFKVIYAPRVEVFEYFTGMLRGPR